MILYESEIEEFALELLRDENGYAVLYGPDLLKGLHPERAYNEVVLQTRRIYSPVRGIGKEGEPKRD